MKLDPPEVTASDASNNSLSEPTTAKQSSATDAIESLLTRPEANISFDANEDSITLESERAISDVAKVIMKDADGRSKFVVDGYADTGSRPEKPSEKLQDLTKRRADNVRQALIDCGVDPLVIVAKGSGPSSLNPVKGTQVSPHDNKRVYIYECEESMWTGLHRGKFKVKHQHYGVHAGEALWDKVSDELEDQIDGRFSRTVKTQYIGIHEAIDRAVSHPHLPKAFGAQWAYQSVRGATARAGVSLTSEKVAHIQAGAVIQALDWRINETGHTRVQICLSERPGQRICGWLSIYAEDGSPVLHRVGCRCSWVLLSWRLRK